MKAWTRCTKAAEAPNQDFNFLRHMKNYVQFDKLIANAVKNKAINHLWYLSDETIAFSLFDKNICNTQKKQMAENILLLADNDESTDSCKRFTITFAIRNNCW